MIKKNAKAGPETEEYAMAMLRGFRFCREEKTDWNSFERGQVSRLRRCRLYFRKPWVLTSLLTAERTRLFGNWT